MLLCPWAIRSTIFYSWLLKSIMDWWNFWQKTSRLKSTVWSTDSDSWVKKVTFIKYIQKFQKRTKLVLILDVTISPLTCNTKIVILIENFYSELLWKRKYSFQVRTKLKLFLKKVTQVTLVTSWCRWLKLRNDFWMLVTSFECWWPTLM